MRPSRAVALVAALVVAALGCKRSGPADGGGVGASKEDASATAVLPFDLYFPAPAGRLRAERRELRVATDSTARASVLVAALLEGPTHEGLAAPLPAGVEVGTVYLSPAPDRVLYLEFRSASLPAPPASGSEQELQTVYSVVDTVLLNIPEIRRVVLLWNGSQRESFAGHVDTASALGAREALIDRS